MRPVQVEPYSVAVVVVVGSSLLVQRPSRTESPSLPPAVHRLREILLALAPDSSWMSYGSMWGGTVVLVPRGLIEQHSMRINRRIQPRRCNNLTPSETCRTGQQDVVASSHYPPHGQNRLSIWTISLAFAWIKSLKVLQFTQLQRAERHENQ